VSAAHERVEAEAYGDVNEAAGLPLLRLAGAVCCALPGLDSPMLNRAIGLGVERPPSDDELDRIEAFFRAAGVRYYVPLAPGCDATLEPRLRERGFEDGYAWMKFSRGVEPPPARETSLVVEPTSDGDVFCRVLAAAFELPPEAVSGWRVVAGRPGWHLFVARDGDEPAGVGALFLHDGIGWLGAAGTVPEQRGRGAQGALLAARIERVRELGAGTVVTETGERVEGRPSHSYRNILRAGFAETYLRPNLLSPQ
jgi:GNAT superfamily N-acetyltransferase